MAVKDASIARRRNIGIIASAAFILSFNHFLNVVLGSISARQKLHADILAGTAQTPYNFRILTPFMNELMVDFLSLFLGSRLSFILGYAIFEFISLFLFLVLFHEYLKRWFSDRTAMIGILFTALSMTVGLRSHYFQPWSLTELVLVMLGILLILDDRYYVLLFVSSIAVLNRSSGILLPALYFFYQIDYRDLVDLNFPIAYSDLGKAVLAGIPPVLMISFLRISRQSTRTSSISEIWTKNIGNLTISVAFVIMFMGVVGWLYVVYAFGSTPKPVKKLSPVFILYLPVVFLFGVWAEDRLLMILYPLLIPSLLTYFDERITTDTASK